MADHNDLGILGESLAAEHLLKKGYHILERNYRFKHLELDIIAQKDQELVVVEVKTRQNEYLTDPTELLSRKKQNDIIKAAENYIHEKEIDLDCRFDLMIVVINQKEKKFNHIEDAFFPLV